MSDNFKTTLIWLLGCVLGLASTIYQIPSVLVDGEFLPYGVDSFYHARRILETIADPVHGFWEFDKRSYAPEGAWHVWPWLYDWLLAQGTRLVMSLSGIGNPMAILAYVPVLFVTVNTALLLGVVQALGLPRFKQILAVLAFVALPLTLHLHIPGRIDHHFMELTCVLATLWGGLHWFRHPQSRWSPPLLGLALGLAPGMQNGLFILQLPVLTTLIVLWIRGLERPGPAAVNRFCLGLGGAAFLVVIPSQPFLDGQFAFYTLSGFHLYIAASVIAAAQFMARMEPVGKNLAVWAAGALLLLLPLLPQVGKATDFLSADLVTHKDIAEMTNMWRLFEKVGLQGLAQSYSLLLFTLPITLLAVARWPFRDSDAGRIFFSLMAWGGGLLLCLSYRMNYFGSSFLILGPLVGAQALMTRFPRQIRLLNPALALFFIGAFQPIYPSWGNRVPFVGNEGYALNRGIFPYLEKACEESPGIVLVTTNEGHYITYHSACSVLSNNMILTAQHGRGVRLTRELLDGSVQAFWEKQRPEIQYVLVFGQDLSGAEGKDEFVDDLPDVLSVQLLQRETPPDGFTLLKKVVSPYFFEGGPQHAVKLFRVRPRAAQGQ